MTTIKQDIRRVFRSVVMTRDGYRCTKCKAAGRDRQGGDGHLSFHDFSENVLVPLDAHHVDDRELTGGDYRPSAGITLCGRCHLEAEGWGV